MRVVLTQKMVVGHVMRYPGEVVEIQETEDRGQESGVRDQESGDTGVSMPIVPEAAPLKPPRRGRKP